MPSTPKKARQKMSRTATAMVVTPLSKQLISGTEEEFIAHIVLRVN
jgi:hypothetical protein